MNQTSQKSIDFIIGITYNYISSIRIIFYPRKYRGQDEGV